MPSPDRLQALWLASFLLAGCATDDAERNSETVDGSGGSTSADGTPDDDGMPGGGGPSDSPIGGAGAPPEASDPEPTPTGPNLEPVADPPEPTASQPEPSNPEPADPEPSNPDEPGLPEDGGNPEPTPLPEPVTPEPTPAPEPNSDPAPVDDAGPSSSRFTSKPVGSTDAGLGYWEYLPPGYGSGPVPLLVFTHGAAWQGEGTEETLQELLEVGPPNLISTDAWPNDRPFIVLSPQNPRSGCFDPGDIDQFYRYAVSNYDVDASRIYHTGQSCGAIGAWGYLAEHLDEFVTAAVLIAGDGRDAFAQAGCDLGRIAIWGLHNELDGSVSSTGTIEPLEALLECDPTPDVQITIYPGETAHDAWTKTYDLSAGHDIYSWLLEHVHP